MRYLILLLLVCASVGAFAVTKVNLGTANTVTFRGTVNNASVAEAQLKLAQLVALRGKAKYPIYLVIDSGGGSIDAGMEFIEYAKSVPNVQTISLFAASMASAIVQALPGKRLIVATGTHMFHRAYAGVQGYLEDGELESRLAYTKIIVSAMELTNYQRIGISKADYKKKVFTEWWMFGQQAVNEHSADEVVDVTCTQSLINAREPGMLDMGFMQLEVEYSSCPLFRTGKPKAQEKT